jgi:glycosyltransferase involved in cell wall biosynthesis
LALRQAPGLLPRALKRTEKLRILIVNFEYPPLGGGGGVVTAWLAEELAKRHEVVVLTSRAFDLPEREVSRGVEILRSQTFFRTQMAVANMPSMASFILSGRWAGRRLMQSRHFDVINTHFALPTGPIGAALARLHNIPNVLSVHGGDLYDPSKWTSPHRHRMLRNIVRRVVHAADSVVGQSHNTIENLLRFYDPALEPTLIPLGIPRPANPLSGRAELGLPRDSIVMIAVGRLVPRKGSDQLVRLISLLKNPRLRLVMLGDGPEYAALKRQAQELGVANQVMLPGFVTDQQKIDFLAASDIYVSTSQHEGFGLVFLEAMAQGLPVVCYNHGGQTDFLKTDVNGAVVPLNDLDQFMRESNELVTNAEKRQMISQQNKSDVEHFFIDNCARRYEALFSEVTATTS